LLLACRGEGSGGGEAGHERLEALGDAGDLGLLEHGLADQGPPWVAGLAGGRAPGEVAAAGLKPADDGAGEAPVAGGGGGGSRRGHGRSASLAALAARRMGAQEASGRFPMVMKAVWISTLVTPSMAKRASASGSPAASAGARQDRGGPPGPPS